MQNLNIQFCTDLKGNLITKQAHSSSNILHTIGINNLDRFAGVEFLLDVEDRLMPSTIVIKCDLHAELFDGEETIIKFPKDGTFTYYKFLVPKLSYFHNGFITDENRKQIPKYTLQCNDVFYYNGLFYVATSSVTTIESELFKENNQYVKIITVDEIWNYQSSIVFSTQKILFSFCNLQKCLVNLQKQILSNPASCNDCGKSSSLASVKQNRDFLLSAIYVLEYLTHTDQFEEAQRVLDGLSDCSGVICKDFELKSDCGCGKII